MIDRHRIVNGDSSILSGVLRTTLLYATIPVVFTIAGSALGACWPRVAGWRIYVLHLAAGVVFSVVAVELLPEIVRRALVTDVVIGFAAGIITMVAVDEVMDRIRARTTAQSESRPHRSALTGVSKGADASEDVTGLAVAVGVDFVLDGLLLGVGFAAGARIGILLALAEAVEQLAVGIALAVELRVAGSSALRALLISGALALLVYVSAFAGGTVLSHLSGAPMEAILSFGLAALLYLVTEELLREAHEEGETRIGTAFFFAGFLAFLVVGMTLG
ncbi:MAG: ZIP family metal transporter [Gemmatimonadaceae bacterium]